MGNVKSEMNHIPGINKLEIMILNLVFHVNLSKQSIAKVQGGITIFLQQPSS